MDDQGEAQAKEAYEADLERQRIEAITMEVDLLQAGVPMPSGNIYSLDLITKAVEEIQPHVDDKKVIGEFDPSSGLPQVKLGQATHYVEKLEVSDEGVLTATLRLMATKRTKDLLLYLKAGGEIKAAPRGFGEVGDGNVVVEYSIVTVDLHSAHTVPPEDPEESDDDERTETETTD
jgi:hypothetical protein